METDIHGTQLYEAATNSLAADASSKNCWSIMATNSIGFDIKFFSGQLKAVEKQIKEEYKLTSMPNAWRSAKSVVLGAMAKGISLKDDNDNIKGKTQVQNELAEKTYRGTEAVEYEEADTSDIAKAMRIFRPFHSRFNDASEEVKVIVRKHLKLSVVC